MIDKKNFMLCQSITEQELEHLDRNRWKANIKFDGERVIAVKKGEDIFLLNRRGNIITQQFREVVNELKAIKHDFIIDGEVVSFDLKFNSLQRRALTKDIYKREQLEKIIPVKYMVFDVISIDGTDMRREKLKDRVCSINRLLGLGTAFNHIERVVYDEIDNLYAIAIENNYEGIVVKDMESLYEGCRSHSWVKRKLFKEGYITITAYSVNPKGIRATDNLGNAVQIAGTNGTMVKEIIDTNGYAEISIQYLEKTKEERYRFISYRGLK